MLLLFLIYTNVWIRRRNCYIPAIFAVKCSDLLFPQYHLILHIKKKKSLGSHVITLLIVVICCRTMVITVVQHLNNHYSSITSEYMMNLDENFFASLSNYR